MHASVLEKIRTLRTRPDFQTNPVRALSRRAVWRLRWLVRHDPWQLRLGDDLDILAPKGGAGALIYYQGFSEPETAAFIESFLKPGMVFWDVGAHIGEYSLLAASQVGDSGRVHAFEPQPGIFELLARNTSDLRNVTLHRHAVADKIGIASLSIEPEPSRSFLDPGNSTPTVLRTVSVDTTSLDEFRRSCACTPHVIKIDVEGAERLVLAGAKSLLKLSPQEAPVWVIEYAPENCTRFYYHPRELVTTLGTYGYRTYWLAQGGLLASTTSPPPWKSSGNMVASKRRLSR